MNDHTVDVPVAIDLNDDAGDLESTPRKLIIARWNAFRLLPRGGVLPFVTLTLVSLALGLLPVVFVIATSVVVGRVPAAVTGGLDSAAWDSLIVAFVVATVAFLFQQLLAPLASSLGALLARRVDRSMYDELMSASLRGSGIGTLEDPEALDDLRVAGVKLEYAVMTPGQACAGLLALVARYTQLIGFAVVVAVAVAWPVAVGLLVAVLLLRHGMRGGLSRYAEARRRLARAERKTEYLRMVAVEPEAGKEIRVFGLADWIRGAFRQVHLTWLTALWSERRRILLWSFLRYAVLSLIVVAAVLGLIGAIAVDALTLTEFVLVMQAALGAVALGGYYPEADMQTAVGMTAHHHVRQFTERVDALPGAAETSPGSIPEPYGTITFENVTFRYPGQERAVFEGLNLTLPVGGCTAIVGVNGVGKTTLVKLLARLYEPESGTILVDGVDIRSYPVDQWRDRIGVIFQDFLRYEASASDNIGFGSVAHLDDREGIRAAAHAAGIAEALEALPRGLDTPLARHMTDGAELSGGEWQRVALARAVFAARHGASILILDEPTASLDVRTEAGFFDQFADLTRGATTLLISHRFSTVRHADQIVVLDGGQVIEHGSHPELLARNGRYAQLFRMQAGLYFGSGSESMEVQA